MRRPPVPLFTRNASAPATAEERVNAAIAQTEAALATFTDVVDELESAASDLDDTATTAHRAADYHRVVAANAESAATKARTSAEKVRTLLG
ncbi:hypothetical protein ACFCV3_41985 [Kribbella sp. NPDC056345]|uniref:hypothetical protein n=1 Tax=Kribbella sp. NPDC056345 TaxID=3345789 RepID=UPI0035D5BA4A